MLEPTASAQTSLRSKALAAIVGTRDCTEDPSALGGSNALLSARAVDEWMGLEAALTAERAHKILRRGIPSKAIGPVGDYLGLGKGALAHYLDLDRSTATRLAAKDQPLPTHSAESVLRLIELKDMAADTFEREADALAWLGRAHPMLEGETPLEAARTSYGAQRVRDILLAIKWGGCV